MQCQQVEVYTTSSFWRTCDIDQICNMTVTIATENTEFWLAGEFALVSIIKRFILTAGRLQVSTAPPAGRRSEVHSDRHHKSIFWLFISVFIVCKDFCSLNWSEDSHLKVQSHLLISVFVWTVTAGRFLLLFLIDGKMVFGAHSCCIDLILK